MVEITDEMVERAQKYRAANGDGFDTRNLLNHTLNPPVKPEIFVSREMELAAEKYWNGPSRAAGNPSPCTFAGLYRVMESKRREEQGYRATIHRRSQEVMIHSHHRKDDPK